MSSDKKFDNESHEAAARALDAVNAARLLSREKRAELALRFLEHKASRRVRVDFESYVDRAVMNALKEKA